MFQLIWCIFLRYLWRYDTPFFQIEKYVYRIYDTTKLSRQNWFLRTRLMFSSLLPFVLGKSTVLKSYLVQFFTFRVIHASIQNVVHFFLLYYQGFVFPIRTDSYSFNIFPPFFEKVNLKPYSNCTYVSKCNSQCYNK